MNAYICNIIVLWKTMKQRGGYGGELGLTSEQRSQGEASQNSVCNRGLWEVMEWAIWLGRLWLDAPCHLPLARPPHSFLTVLSQLQPVL